MLQSYGCHLPFLMWMDKPSYSWGTRERCSSTLRPRILQTRERLSSLLAPSLLGQEVSVTPNSTQLCQPLLTQECSLTVFQMNYRWTHWQEPSISDMEAAETGWPQVRERLGTRCEFKSNLDYVVKHCLKAKPKKKNRTGRYSNAEHLPSLNDALEPIHSRKQEWVMCFSKVSK